MLVAQLLDSVRKRVPWSTMRTIFKMCDLPVGRGWEDTVKKLTDAGVGKDDFTDNFDLLKELYCNHLIIGEKSLKLFRSDRSRIDNLIGKLRHHKVKTTIFHDTYPFLLSTESLVKTDSTPKLVEIREAADNMAVVFCTKRFFTERTEIDPEGLSAEAREALNDYDELVGIKRYTRQFFDVVVLRKDKELIEIRLDIMGGMPSQERSRAFIQIIKKFNSLANKTLGIETLLGDSTNFFPLIDCLYESSEGKVGELAFTTDEGSIKFEKMRRGEVDLRDETYHRAGRKAVDHITPYRLAVLWKFLISEGLETQPELLLPGKSRTLSELTQKLDEVIIKKCSGLDDYSFVFEKIISYLNQSDE
jgi:hypothetical protein